jgi:hypothetical protein
MGKRGSIAEAMEKAASRVPEINVGEPGSRKRRVQRKIQRQNKRKARK